MTFVFNVMDEGNLIVGFIGLTLVTLVDPSDPVRSPSWPLFLQPEVWIVVLCVVKYFNLFFLPFLSHPEPRDVNQED